MQKLRSFGFLDSLLFFVIQYSLSSIVCLSFEIFYPIYLAIASVVGAIAFHLFYVENRKLNLSFKWLALLFIIFLLFRLPPGQHVTGGQDQGLYTIMGEQFKNHKSLYYKDDFRQNLTDELKSIYDFYKPPSIDLHNSERSLFVIDFYPLLPAWLALGSSLFGSYQSSIIVVFFSILSMFLGLRFIQLAYVGELSSKNTSLFLLLFALNPVLIFFGKQTYTEVPAMVFSMGFFYYFAKGYLVQDSRAIATNWLLSILLFTCFCFNRISFILLIPILLVILIHEILFNIGSRRIKWLFAFITILVLVSTASVLYYKTYIPALYLVSYYDSQHKLILLLSAAILVAVIVVFLLKTLLPKAFEALLLQLKSIVLFFTSDLSRIFKVVFGFSILTFIYFIIFPNLRPFELGLSGSGENLLTLFRYHILWKWFLFLGPITFLFLKIQKLDLNLIRKPILIIYIVFFASIFMILHFWTFKVPYLYYYGRYLTSEVLPISIILAFLFYLCQPRSKIFIYLTVFFYLIAAAPMLLKTEGDGNNFFKELSYLIGEKIVVVHSDSTSRTVLDGLKFFYNKNIFVLDEKKFDTIKTQNFLKQLSDYLKLQNQADTKIVFLSNREIPQFDHELIWKYKFLSNGEHLRHPPGVQNPDAFILRRFLYPMRYEWNETRYYLKDVSL